MTTRRAFLAGTIAAATAALSNPARAQSAGRTSKLKTKDGTELFIRDTGGSGRAVVMTHAWPLSSVVWEFQAAALSKAGCRVITYDRRGFGQSSQPAGAYDFDSFADDLAAVIEQTGVRVCVDAFSKTDFRAELASVNVPTLLLHGTADIPVPFAMAKATADGIAKSKLIEYRDASHGIVLTERDRVAGDLLGFMAG